MKVSEKIKIIDHSIAMHSAYIELMKLLENSGSGRKTLKNEIEILNSLIDDLKKLKYDICDNG